MHAHATAHGGAQPSCDPTTQCGGVATRCDVPSPGRGTGWSACGRRRVAARAASTAAAAVQHATSRCPCGQRRAHSRCRCGWGEPHRGADVAAVSPVSVQTWPADAHIVDENELVAQPLVVANVLGDAKHLHAGSCSSVSHPSSIRRTLAHSHARRRSGARARTQALALARSAPCRASSSPTPRTRSASRGSPRARRDASARPHPPRPTRARRALRPSLPWVSGQWLVPHGAGDTWSAVPSTVADTTVTAVPLRCGRASIAISTY